MRQSSIILLCGSTLVVGLILGANFGTPALSLTVHADQAETSTSKRLYRELGQEGTALQEGSTLLAKIAAVTAPAVVHIQSERRIPGKGKEEDARA